MTADLPILHAPTLSALSGVAHGFFTRQGGVSDGVYASLNCGPGSRDKALAVAENRRRVGHRLGARDLATLYQVHGADVMVLDRPDQADARPRADAIVTRLKGIAVGILTADCTPVLLADAEAGVVGAAHAGWRGALADVTGAAVVAMEELGADRRRIAAAVGPCIAQASYEVGAEVRAEAVAVDAGFAGFFVPGRAADKFQFDLAGLVAHRLKATGVHRVDALGLDTYAEPARFFSYRRNSHDGLDDYGRMLSAVMVAR